VSLDFDLDQIIASLAPRSAMMAFVLDGRLDPLAEVFGLVHYDTVPLEQLHRFRALLRDLEESNAEIEPVRARITDQLPLARSGSATLRLRQAYALVDRLHQGNTRLAELITTFLAG
jgi:hypothetical protein